MSSLKYLQKERRAQKKGRGSLAEILGLETKDALSKNNFKIMRYNDMMTANSAAVMDVVESSTAAERLREDERERKILLGWRSVLGSMNSNKKEEVLKALMKYSEDEEERIADYANVRKEWRETALSTDFSGFAGPIARTNMEGLAADMFQNEAILFSTLREECTEAELDGVAKLIAGSDMKAVTPKLLEESPDQVFVIDFDGDSGATGVGALSMEITTLLEMRTQPKEVIMKVTSPGGTVTGYGLAAAEMKRLTGAGITLTVCIDQLAASGGYLMACVADKIVCAPYAAVGSIGVIAQLPNVADRLEREGIEFITTTAGKWKRTVTPFNKPSEADLEKQKADIMMVYRQFAQTVKSNRPHLVIDEVATGEVWYGSDALDRGLVDKLQTSSDYIREKMSKGAELFSIKYTPAGEGGLAAVLQGSSASSISEAALAALMQSQKKEGLLGSLLNNNVFNGGITAQSEAQQLQLLSQSNLLPQLQALPMEARIELAKVLMKM